ncbi:MAG: hypothetical protein P4L99_12745 [Chthoniobacter sp.]|nr:hypothetical protein [Chthoniobacter sp.]
MIDVEYSELVEATVGNVLKSLGFKGPIEHELQSGTAFELAYFKEDFGVSIEVDLLDDFFIAYIYEAGNEERFRPTFRDDAGKIKKRYLNEILRELGFISERELKESNKRLRKLALDFRTNAKALCEEEANSLKRWVPVLLPLRSSLGIKWGSGENGIKLRAE